MLGDLDDYIAPSQACIKPVTVESVGGKVGTITVEGDGSYIETDEQGVKKQLKKATITLADCLACSGCVTTAETILIQQQSHEEFLNRLQDAGKTKVVSISPQSRTSLATHFRLSSLQVMRKLTTLFHDLGVKYVFDTTYSRDISLLESCEEFVKRYKQLQSAPQEKGLLPMLASACPGWVCYAEKRHSDIALPFISTARSPMAVMGVLVKRHLASRLGLRPSDIYHASIMPCFDKKLEASRNDFYDAQEDSHDVDTVLSTGEIVTLLEEKEIDFMTLRESPLDTLFTSIDESQQILYGHEGGGSGGYLHHVLTHAARELFGMESVEVKYRQLSNVDFQEATVTMGDKVVLRGALAYGFRNIQNIIRKLSQGRQGTRRLYDFVEIMACPSGCLNGGGQLRATQGENGRELLKRMREEYGIAATRDPRESSATKLRAEMLQSTQDPALFHTQYHQVKPMDHLLSSAMKW